MARGTEKITFEGAFGDTLAAALERPSGPPRAYALFAHCFSCSKDIHAARRITQALARAGFAVLRFDFTGLGQSDGDFANTNFSSNVEDLVRAADHMRENYGAPQLLIGHSLGGAAVLTAAERIPEAKAVATIGAPSSAENVKKQFAAEIDAIERDGEAEVSLAGRPFKIKKQFLDDIAGHNVEAAVAGLKRALMVFHSPLDATVSIDHATRIYSAAKHPKTFVSLDNADHLLTRSEDSHFVASMLAAWAARYIDVEPEPEEPKVERGAVAAFDAGTGRWTQTAVIDGFRFTIDAGEAEGGDGLGPNPTRLLEASLAACGSMTMRMYAERKGWPLTRGVVQVAPDPDAEGQDLHAVKHLLKTVTLDGDLSAEQRERLHEIADKCPVHRVLTNGVSVRSELKD